MCVVVEEYDEVTLGVSDTGIPRAGEPFRFDVSDHVDRARQPLRGQFEELVVVINDENQLVLFA